MSHALASVVCLIHVDCALPHAPECPLRAGERYALHVADAELLVSAGKAVPDASIEPVLDDAHPSAAELLAHLTALVPALVRTED